MCSIMYNEVSRCSDRALNLDSIASRTTSKLCVYFRKLAKSPQVVEYLDFRHQQTLGGPAEARQILHMQVSRGCRAPD